MKRILKISLFGFLVWLILFIIGIILWPLNESHFLLFKSIMVVVSSLFGILFLFIYFKKVESNFVFEGILVGIIWLAINILLDLIFIVGVFKSPVAEYFIGIGLRYLNIPIMSIGIGLILNKKIGK